MQDGWLVLGRALRLDDIILIKTRSWSSHDHLLGDQIKSWSYLWLWWSRCRESRSVKASTNWMLCPSCNWSLRSAICASHSFSLQFLISLCLYLQEFLCFLRFDNFQWFSEPKLQPLLLLCLSFTFAFMKILLPFLGPFNVNRSVKSQCLKSLHYNGCYLPIVQC